MKKIQLYTFLFAVIFTAWSCRKATTPAIIELIDTDNSFTTSDLMQFCSKNHIDTSTLFEWENHWVIYSTDREYREVSQKLENEFRRLIVKTYDKPFYNFNREKLTGEKAASEWEHIIMTANLVNDTTLQNEYMEYHRTQLEKWPEISKGFINADFQQLLVFRNGRQLILVISIPKGKTLDELNPKTTENNPRVDEWNKIMAKYQEGIEDAPQETTWVMFQKVAP